MSNMMLPTGIRILPASILSLDTSSANVPCPINEYAPPLWERRMAERINGGVSGLGAAFSHFAFRELKLDAAFPEQPRLELAAVFANESAQDGGFTLAD